MDDGSESRHASELRAKTSELRDNAAARAESLRHSAASKSEELRHSAAARSTELGRTAAQRGSEMRRRMSEMDMPWARCRPARLARESILQFGLKPLMAVYTRLTVRGRERFDDVPPPVILVANHCSHLDTPTILRALPRAWRQRTAVAAAADYFYTKRVAASAVALAFNTVPMMRRGGGAGEGAIDHVDDLLDERWNLLMFPEGTRSRDGRLGKLRSGAAVIAQQHDIPIVPVYVKGTHDAMPPGRNWPRRARRFLPRRHRLEVCFGPPIRPAAGEAPRDVMDRLRAYLDEQTAGAPATHDGEPQRPGAGTRFVRAEEPRDVPADV
jgi:1-acyl-sn-glycerol-3-phosphate acyltransferase